MQLLFTSGAFREVKCAFWPASMTNSGMVGRGAKLRVEPFSMAAQRGVMPWLHAVFVGIRMPWDLSRGRVRGSHRGVQLATQEMQPSRAVVR